MQKCLSGLKMKHREKADLVSFVKYENFFRKSKIKQNSCETVLLKDSLTIIYSLHLKK